jgi:hypothetical protein
VYATFLDNAYYVSTFADLIEGTTASLTNSIELLNSHLELVKHNDYILIVEGMGKGQTIFKFKRDDDGKLYEDSHLTLDANTNPTEIIVANDEKAYVTCYLGAKSLITFNPKTMEKIGSIDLSEYAVGDNNPDPGSGIVRDDKLFLALNQNITEMSVHDSAYVAIINTSTDEVEKVIIDPRASSIGMVGHTTPFMDESKNIYFYTGPLAAMMGMHEGMLRIKAGETEWDEDYFLSLQQLGDADPTSYSMYMYYAGSGDVYCFLEKSSLIADPSNYDYVSDHDFVPYKFNVNTKTGGMIDLPASNGYAAKGMAEVDGKIYFGLSTTTGVGFYSYDPETKTGSTSPVVSVSGAPLDLISFKD